jgi:hypothetical protein
LDTPNQLSISKWAQFAGFMKYISNISPNDNLYLKETPLLRRIIKTISWVLMPVTSSFGSYFLVQ